MQNIEWGKMSRENHKFFENYLLAATFMLELKHKDLAVNYGITKRKRRFYL